MLRKTPFVAYSISVVAAVGILASPQTPRGWLLTIAVSSLLVVIGAASWGAVRDHSQDG